MEILFLILFSAAIWVYAWQLLGFTKNNNRSDSKSTIEGIITGVLGIIILITGFQASGFTVCSFVPRLFDFHPEAIPAPYPHSNVDSDEVIFYSKGNFMSRKGISEGSITYHPMGLPHGPQPGKYEESIGKKSTDELAVMIDTFEPLYVAKKSEQCSDDKYPFSWLEKNK